MATTYERSWETRRGRGGGGRDTKPGYYGLPVIHRPHWRWLIIFYFFLGGIAAASYVVGSVALLFGGREGRQIVRASRYVSLAALIPSPILLILDLHRPERFLNMLRVFKFRSPMSVGTWGLVTFSAFSGLAALIQAERDGLFGRDTLPARLLRALPARVIALIGVGPAFFVSGYTGVLLAATAVPLWTRNYLLMGPVFLTSAASTGTAAIILVLTLARGTSYETLRRLQRLDGVTRLAELALLTAVRANLSPTLARPLMTGTTGRVFRVGVLGTGIGGPLLFHALGALRIVHHSRVVVAISAMLTLAGGLMLRYVMVMAGRASADDPEATFELTSVDGKG
jgi:formate-dependent nitrite reductase membrane component NrfD